MKEEIKDLVVSSGLLTIGIYTRVLFGGRKYTWQQKLALLLFGLAIVLILNLTRLQPIYQTSISLVGGLLMPNIVLALIKAGNKSQDVVADKIADKIEDIID
jgi:drug/metabolite transporter (DMT)-like permease